jgi:alkylated DNA nucleotide flippase Atl1
MAGKPRAARAVGNLMRSGRLGHAPYHRVIAAAGRLGGYGGNEPMKAALLRSEGLVVAGGRVRRFREVRWPAQNGQ